MFTRFIGAHRLIAPRDFPIAEQDVGDGAVDLEQEAAEGHGANGLSRPNVSPTNLVNSMNPP